MKKSEAHSEAPLRSRTAEDTAMQETRRRGLLGPNGSTGGAPRPEHLHSLDSNGGKTLFVEETGLPNGHAIHFHVN